MSTTLDLVSVIKKELKTLNMTYADLAQALGMAESSVKRMLAKGDMSLARVDEICRAMKLDFAELARGPDVPAWIERARRRDPDLWVIELDIPQAGQFVAEMLDGG